jgi:hypothetical protein
MSNMYSRRRRAGYGDGETKECRKRGDVVD